MKKKNIYLAGPLFTFAERIFLTSLRDKFREISGITVVWPGDLFDEAELANLGRRAKEHIFQGCVEELKKASLVVALLDGTQVDDGTAWEIGYAYAHSIPVWGLRTDFRNAGETSFSLVNCMVECSCERVFRNPDELLQAVGE